MHILILIAFIIVSLLLISLIMFNLSSDDNLKNFYCDNSIFNSFNFINYGQLLNNMIKILVLFFFILSIALCIFYS
ncbi:hypothetical protein [Buchnera aphidicola]|uniref:hypothetical protein n=1 Tax=Buchnera aphidicola TaxID=9 RepID=UPI0034645173